MVTVLYDGWPLVYAPNSSEALHLLAILACRPAAVQAHLALPGEPPPWLPPGAEVHVLPTGATPGARLAWEQRSLPGLCRRLGADLLHLTSPNPPLFGSPVAVVSPASFEEPSAGPGSAWRSFSGRLRLAASQGGMARLRGLIWPDDLPPPHGTARISSLPPLATLDFTTPPTAAMGETPDLPEGSVLYHGPGSPSALRLLLSAWSWVAGPMGEAYSLVALGLDKEGREGLSVLALEYGLGDTVRSLPPLSPSGLVAAYRGAAALLHPASEPPWGGPVRLALARGLPVVSFLDSRIEALVGPAAYLVKRDDARALGAALITVLVEGEISEQLAQGGLQRAAAWSPTAFAAGLEQAYSDTVFLKSPTPNPSPK